MHSRKIIIGGVVLAFVASVLVGFFFFMGSDAPEDATNTTEANGDDAGANDSGTTDTQSEDGELVIEEVSLDEEIIQYGDTIEGEIQLATEGDERVDDTLEFHLLDGNETVVDDGTATVQADDDMSLTITGIEVPDDVAHEELTLSVYAPSSGETLEDTFPVELPTDENSVVLYPYQQNTSEENALSGDELIITDAAGDEVERLTDWNKTDVQNNELLVDGLVEGETHTVEIPEPYNGTWPAESVQFDPGDTDSIDIVAGYELTTAQSFRLVDGEYVTEDFEWEHEEYREEWERDYTARAYAPDEDGVWHSKFKSVQNQRGEEDAQLRISGGAEEEGGVSLGSRYSEDTFTIEAIDDDGSADRENVRFGYPASTQNAFHTNNDDPYRFEFLEETELEGSVVKDSIGKGIVVDDEQSITEWIQSLEQADQTLAELGIVHKYKFHLDDDADAEYQYRYVDPETGELLRIEQPYPSSNEVGHFYVAEYFDHGTVTPADFTAPIFHPDDFDEDGEYEKEDFLED